MINSQGRSKESMGKINRRIILSEIVLKGPVTRSQIARNTGLTGASVSRITRHLIMAGLIREREALANESRPGRPFIELETNPAGGYLIGMVINAYQQSIVLIDLHNDVVGRCQLPVDDLRDAEHVLSVATIEINKMIVMAAIEPSRILGMGVAVTGAINVAQGVVKSSPFIAWENVPLCDILSEYFSFPIHLDNIPNTLNLAEHRFGQTKHLGNTLLINMALRFGTSSLINKMLAGQEMESMGLLGEVSINAYDTSEMGTPKVRLDDVSSGYTIVKQYQQIKNTRNVDNIFRKREMAHQLREMIEKDQYDDEVATMLYRAGVVLGRVLEAALSILPTEALILAGPLASSTSYVKGIKQVLKDSTSIPNELQVVVSGMSYESAVRWIAINEFIVARDLDIDALMIAPG